MVKFPVSLHLKLFSIQEWTFAHTFMWLLQKNYIVKYWVEFTIVGTKSKQRFWVVGVSIMVGELCLGYSDSTQQMNLHWQRLLKISGVSSKQVQLKRDIES